MSVEKKIAWAGVIGGTGWAVLMWTLAQFGIQWPPELLYFIGAVAIVGLIVAAILWCHIAWMWLRRKGLQLGPTIVIAISLAGLLVGVIWGGFTWKGPTAPQITAGGSPANAVPTPQPLPSPSATSSQAKPRTARARKPAVRPATRPSVPAPIPGIGTARVVVSRYEFFPLDKNNPLSDFGLRIYTINKGAITGDAPITTATVLMANGEPPAADIDTEMQNIVKYALTVPPPFGTSAQLDTDVEAWTEIKSSLRIAYGDYVSSRQSKLRLYVLAVLAFRDATLGPEKVWLTEFCVWQTGDIAAYKLCDTHNGTRLYDVPKRTLEP